ncbi:MAG: hypothetical protein HOO91_11345 [Bacteroidales bacterium]|nr:hypothetical protein [Bacteroidales bacterium]
MKTFSKISLIFIVLFSLSCNSGKVDENEVLNKIMNLCGEKETVQKIKDQKQVWSIHDSKGNNLKCFYFYKRPNKFKMQIITMDGNPLLLTIYDGNKGINKIFGETHIMTQTELNEYRITILTWLDKFSVYQKKDFNFIKNIKDDDKEYLVFDVTDEFKQKHRIYVNSETKTIDIIEESHIDIISKQPSARKIVTKSYTKIENVTYPQEVVVQDVNESNQVANNARFLKLESVFNNINIEDSEFDIDAIIKEDTK